MYESYTITHKRICLVIERGLYKTDNVRTFILRPILCPENEKF